MILVADSGSTKTDWFLCNSHVNKIFTTVGINPFFVGKEEIINILRNELPVLPDSVSKVFFYGAGCTPEKSLAVQSALKQHFQTDKINVASDLLGAARSLCGDEAGIACILGTGSNSCIYDGKKITRQIFPLGFILGDEGSGANLGKRLVTNILRNQLPAAIQQSFFDTFKINVDNILDNIYRKPFPNRYLAQFATFVEHHTDCQEILKLIENSFSAFIEQQILPYKSTKDVAINFVGSIAFTFKNILEPVLKNYDLKTGKIQKSPLQGLLEYHKVKH
ncbi:MAG: ATPase [Dysgonamonadaceae bacterium]|jgi:N-acetylglucosamine kinase-like BadF-type ATPase|nr:ATPase [Dysgonamonadaceae bacterium]